MMCNQVEDEDFQVHLATANRELKQWRQQQQ